MPNHELNLHDYWWCEYHVEVHRGPLTSWGIDHRNYLHPVVAKASPGRPFLTPMGLGPTDTTPDLHDPDERTAP